MNIYEGEEIGMTNPNFTSIKDYRDVESLNAYQELKDKHLSETEILKILAQKSRDNARTPVQWDASEMPVFRTANHGLTWRKIIIKSMLNRLYKIKNPCSTLTNA